MLILGIARWLLVAWQFWLAVPVLYLFVVSLSAILKARKLNPAARSLPETGSGYPSFALLIPAHNEEATIGRLLDSLGHLVYPEDRYTVCVVADNCTDSTASLARSYEAVRVYERFDEQKRGKGFALNWIVQQITEARLRYDAYIVIDADSVVSPTFVQAMAREFTRGAQALQGCNTVLNASDSPTTALRWLALTLMNHVRPLGRNGLRASSNLSGNGMCLGRALLEKYPWHAFALAEDYQYYLTLIEHGERVRYVPDAVVRSEMPTTFSQMRSQDFRWESSAGGDSKWRTTGRLLMAGIRQRDFARLEAIAELWTPPLSLLVSCSLLSLLLSIVLWSFPQIILSLVLVGGLCGYLASALLTASPPSGVYKALLHAPGFMLWKLRVLLVLKIHTKHTSEWVRTSRTSS